MSPDEEYFITSTVAHLTKKSRRSYDPCLPIGECKFEPNKKYGPFFRADKKEIEWYFKANPKHANWAGLAEPRSRQEAKDWYATPSKNPLTHVHRFYILVPKSEKREAVGFVGKVKKGTGFQVDLNHIAVKYIVQCHVKKLPK